MGRALRGDQIPCLRWGDAFWVEIARRVEIPLGTVACAGLSVEEQTTLEGVSQATEVRAAFDGSGACANKLGACERAAGREQRVRTAREVGKVPQFAIGEFVLITAAVPRSKLRVRWLGPLRVVSKVNEWVYVLEDIVSGKHRTVHAQRMKLYADADFMVTEYVRNQAAYDDNLGN